MVTHLQPSLHTVSAERDELLRLVQGLPEHKVPRVLDVIRRHLQPAGERPWLPTFFASAPGDGTRIADEGGRATPRGLRAVAGLTCFRSHERPDPSGFLVQAVPNAGSSVSRMGACDHRAATRSVLDAEESALDDRGRGSP